MAAWTSPSSRSSTSSSASCARSSTPRRADRITSRRCGAAAMCCASPRKSAPALSEEQAADSTKAPSLAPFPYSLLAFLCRLQLAEAFEQLRAVERLQQIALGAGALGPHDRAD